MNLAKKERERTNEAERERELQSYSFNLFPLFDVSSGMTLTENSDLPANRIERIQIHFSRTFSA